MAGGALGGFVLDASALLALLQNEPGGPEVMALIAMQAEPAIINVANYAEVLTRLSNRGDTPTALDHQLRADSIIGGLIELVPLVHEDAVTIAELRSSTRAQGLSLGDRACLATARRLGRTALTADRAWAALDLDISLHFFR